MVTGDLLRPAQVSYTKEQCRRMATREFHNTIREVLNVLHTIQRLSETTPMQIVGKMLLYLTDNHATFYAIMGLKSQQRETIGLVFDIWQLCMKHDIEVTVRWCSG